MTGESIRFPGEDGEERRMTSYLTLADFIGNIEKMNDEAGVTDPEEIFASMAGPEAIMYDVDAKKPENMALMIDAILEDELLNRKLKWLYLEMHQIQANFLRDTNPRLSQIYLDLADRFAESTGQSHMSGPVFIDDGGPNLRWDGQKIPLSLEAESVRGIVSEPADISVAMNVPVGGAVEYLRTGDPAVARASVIRGLDWECSIKTWTADR